MLGVGRDGDLGTFHRPGDADRILEITEAVLKKALIAPFRLNLGTPLFFVISGYCIAASIESCRRRGLSPVSFSARAVERVRARKTPVQSWFLDVSRQWGHGGHA